MTKRKKTADKTEENGAEGSSVKKRKSSNEKGEIPTAYI